MIHRVAQAIVKRIPAHAADRLEEALLPRRDFERLAVPREPALSVICDDGELKDLEIVEVLASLGLKGVFAVSPDLVGRPGFLSYTDLRAIHAAGHEIAFHGSTHDPFTGFADAQALDRVTVDGLSKLRGEGLGDATTLVYPFGKNNRRVRTAVSRRFRCAFTTWFGLNGGQVNRFAMRRIPFGAYTGKLPATAEWYRVLIDRCAAGHHWPALMLHPSAPEHRSSHTRLLGELLSHALERGVAVRTVADHLPASAAAASPARSAA